MFGILKPYGTSEPPPRMASDRSWPDLSAVDASPDGSRAIVAGAFVLRLESPSISGLVLQAALSFRWRTLTSRAALPDEANAGVDRGSSQQPELNPQQLLHFVLDVPTLPVQIRPGPHQERNCSGLNGPAWSRLCDIHSDPFTNDFNLFGRTVRVTCRPTRIRRAGG